MGSQGIIDLDSAATTAVDPRVLQCMEPFHRLAYGNPSSQHRLGAAAHRALEETRRQLADLLGTASEGVVFTSGATEANNLGVRGICSARRRRGRHVLVGSTEHASVLEAVAALADEGYEVEPLACDSDGRITPEGVHRRLRPDTVLVALMLGNNETGTLHPIRDIARYLRSKPSPPALHVDAVQGFPGLPIHLERDAIASVSISAHKFHGPKGVGALVLGRGIRILPILRGGGQESGLRSGTQNVPGIVGMGEAIRIARESIQLDHRRMRRLRDRLAEALTGAIGEARVLGDPWTGLPHILSLAVPGIPGEVLLHHLDREGILVSTGSACSERRRTEASHVLGAMGVPPGLASGSVRFSLSRFTTGEEIERVAEAVPRLVAKIRREARAR